MEIVFYLIFVAIFIVFIILILFVGYKVDLFFRKLIFKLLPFLFSSTMKSTQQQDMSKNSVVLFEWSINFSRIESRLIINGLKSFLILFVFSIFLTTLIVGFDDLTPSKMLIILFTSIVIILITYVGVFLRGKFFPNTVAHYFTYRITSEGIFQTNTINPIVFKRNSYSDLFIPFAKLQNPEFVGSKYLVSFKRGGIFRYYLWCDTENYQAVSEYIKGIYKIEN